LPTGGGGIDIRVGGESDQYFEYDTGELVIHDGMTPHRIASYREYKPDEYRITLARAYGSGWQRIDCLLVGVEHGRNENARSSRRAKKIEKILTN
jgi:hypothetical protein